jgi:hypothetical protein
MHYVLSIRYPTDTPQIYSALSSLGARLSTLVEEVLCLLSFFPSSLEKGSVLYVLI